MARQKTRFVCQECGTFAIKWQGKCNECGGWNTFVEEAIPSKVETVKPHCTPELLHEIHTEPEMRSLTSIDEFDRVTGGGLVPGSIVLIGGAPGIGKSTLLLQIAQKVSSRKGNVLYVTGEESSHQVKIRSLRLGISSEKIYLLPETNLEAIKGAIEEMKPELVLVDSIQTLYQPEFSGSPGSVTQIRECTASLVRVGKTLGATIIIVGHVTKDGAIAGPRVLEHLVDTVLYFEGEDTGSFRVLKSVKNRFGSTNEVGIFQMGSDGLRSVENPSAFFLSQRREVTPGSIIVPVMEGTRPILVEIQALVTGYHEGGFASRKAKGIDSNRLSLLLAVLERHTGCELSKKDVYINVVGGMELDEPAIDLGIAIAIASSESNNSPAEGCVAFGEVGLSGEIRPVSQMAIRILEAERLGFRKCILPRYNFDSEKPESKTLTFCPVRHVKEALNCSLGPLKKDRRLKAVEDIKFED